MVRPGNRIDRWAPIEKRSRKGFRGYPVATIAFYGPNDEFASKVVVGIVPAKAAEVDTLERWFSDDRDVRKDASIGKAIRAVLRRHGVKTVAMADRILGCPHEEGIDYSEGEICPQCPFWAYRDRWSGEIIQ